MARTCRNCLSRCFAITLKCLFTNSTYLKASLPMTKVENALDAAQVDYLKPLLGDCWAELCTAVSEYETDGTPIPEKWETLIAEATGMLVSATEFKYLQKGRVLLAADKLPVIADISSEDWSDFIKGLKAEVLSQQSMFSEWLKQHASDYPCLPVKSCGKPAETGFMSDWMVVKGNPRVGKRPPFQEF